MYLFLVKSVYTKIISVILHWSILQMQRNILPSPLPYGRLGFAVIFTSNCYKWLIFVNVIYLLLSIIYLLNIYI